MFKHAVLRFSFLLPFVLFLSGSISAQDNGKEDRPSDEELKEYLEVEFALRDIRRERKKEVMEVIEGSELGMKGYRKASRKANDPDQELDEEKLKSYESLKKEVKELQEEYRQKEKAKMEEMGMEPSRYRELSEMKNNKKVRKRMLRLKEKMMDEAQEENNKEE